MKRHLYARLSSFFALAWAQEPGTIIYKGKTGELRVEHYATYSMDLASGVASFKGNPVLVSWKDRGITISAGQIEANVPIDDQSGHYYIKTGKFSGNVVFAMDSDQAYAYQVQRAKELGIQPDAMTPKKAKV